MMSNTALEAQFGKILPARLCQSRAIARVMIPLWRENDWLASYLTGKRTAR